MTKKPGAATRTTESSHEVEMIMEKMLEELATTQEVAAKYGWSQEHVSHLIKGEKIAARKLGGVYIVYLPSVEEYLKTKSSKGRPRSRTPD